MTAYLEKRGLQEEHKQYLQLAGLFDRAAEQLSDRLAQQDVPYCRKLLLELGKEALSENGDWILLHRSRPLSVLTG